ncbi:hypothetical protein [Streptomyces qinzhouensis]|uniref:hypothetical protein n=1 Tax=Streptomyces qinzhouensis TaxID=2599401 RepID=UPI001646853E|nr:hypothetical protein [Streptomyces qinzhouensis]
MRKGRWNDEARPREPLSGCGMREDEAAAVYLKNIVADVWERPVLEVVRCG